MNPLASIALAGLLAGVPVIGPGEAIIDLEQPGAIDGTVVDSVTGVALAGVRLALFHPTLAASRQYPEPWVAEGSPGSGVPLARIAADDEGGFRFVGLRPGRYLVRARGEHVSTVAAVAVVTLETPLRSVLVEVEVGARVRGRVVDAQGQPLGSFSVRLTGHDAGDGLNSVARNRGGLRLRTDEQGHFEILPLPTGVVYLQASDRRYGFSELLRLEVRSGDVLEGVEIVVPDERELLARREADGGGVGVRLEFEPAGPKIRSLLPGMPAEEAGLLVDDRIVSLGGMDTRFMAPSEFIHRCRGAVGEPVTLGVRTGEEPPRDVVLLRRVLESRAR